MKKIICLMAVVVLCCAVFVPGAHAEDAGSATGFLKTGDEKVVLAFSHAVQKARQIRIILLDRPVPSDIAEDHKQLVEMAAAGQLSGLELITTAGETVDEVFFLDKRLPSELSVMARGAVTHRSFQDGILSGRVVMEDPDFSFGYDARFTAIVVKAAEKEVVSAGPGASVQEKAMAALQNKGLDFDEKTFRRKVMDGDAAAVKLFLDAGMEPEILGRPAIAEAVESGHADVVEVLIEAGSDVNVKDEAGQSLALQAASHNKPDILEALIKAGADVNIPNTYGSTPLMSAASDGSVRMVRALLDAGARVNKRSPAGGTALQAAVFGGHREVVKLLIAAGADVARDRAELIQIARRQKHREIEKMLRNAPAKGGS